MSIGIIHKLLLIGEQKEILSKVNSIERKLEKKANVSGKKKLKKKLIRLKKDAAKLELELKDMIKNKRYNENEIT